jgi:hypothetical protein
MLVRVLEKTNKNQKNGVGVWEKEGAPESTKEKTKPEPMPQKVNMFHTIYGV